jgi:hypothetical protein
LWYKAPTVLPAGDRFVTQPCHQQAAPSVLCTTSCKQSNAPEDGRNYRPKHVELIEITNKLLFNQEVNHILKGQR